MPLVPGCVLTWTLRYLVAVLGGGLGTWLLCSVEFRAWNLRCLAAVRFAFFAIKRSMEATFRELKLVSKSSLAPSSFLIGILCCMVLEGCVVLQTKRPGPGSSSTVNSSTSAEPETTFGKVETLCFPDKRLRGAGFIAADCDQHNGQTN